ncbi:MAG TPA: sigma-70 family RNA polymerase sigma factor [Clostridia bacterium]|nr:sigma-70 family RNA polymerase sigma factor [Clostridia bacterium]
MDSLEKKLIVESQKGDMESFEELIKEYQKGAYNIAYRMLGNTEDAKDASQEAMIKIYRSIGGFRMNSSFKTWFFRVVTNTCLDYRRKRSRNKVLYLDKAINSEEGSFQREVEDSSEGPEEILVRNENIKTLQKYISGMPEKYAMAIILRDVRGFSYSEMVEILDLPEGTVKSRISRARIMLKNIIANNMEQNDMKTV